MLFNSFHFLVFFTLIVFLYFLTPSRFRWVCLLIASYYFYMCWKLEYGLILFALTASDYFIGKELAHQKNPFFRKLLLTFSICFDLGFLFFFKYFNFFSFSINSIFLEMDRLPPIYSLNILLPIGISFFVFQSLGYTIDIYRRKREPEPHFGFYALYVAYFPQLVAGPIERSTHLLPQLHHTYQFDYDRVTSGLRLMAWGFFKKLVIADKLAVVVNTIFYKPSSASAFTLILTCYFFSFQIYCDFSGYTDIARGSARVMGHDIMENFKAPYYARSIREFWGRWHISLSTWFRDYLYIPLGGNRVSRPRWALNIMTVFCLSGLWHGASWNFLVWGCLHGFYLVFSEWTRGLRNRLAHFLWFDKFPKFRGVFQIFFTFHLVTFSWIFFRAESFSDATFIIKRIVDYFVHILTHLPQLGQGNHLLGYTAISRKEWFAIGAIAILEIIHQIQRRKPLQKFITEKPLLVRWACYVLIVLGILCCGELGAKQFIYFQF